MRSSPSVSVPSVRLRLEITGVVQGVGFRPAVARAAIEHGVGGFVYNDAGSVHCELEGAAGAVDAVVTMIRNRPPPMARIDDLAVTRLAPKGDSGFAIVESRRVPGDRRTLVPPDIAICDDCLRELRAPGDRRYGHPFITCTNCGPRYTVITDLPYDRPATTMAKFPMCVRCAAEYHDPADRRFHAQTIACHDCGPTLSWSGPGAREPLAAAAAALADGLIVAVKGIGGYHLACRADNAVAVADLRRRKSRPVKPFAVMVADLAAAGRIAVINDVAARQLSSPSAPIVLVPARDEAVLAAVAPGLGEIGLMLAYSPVHHLLFDRLGPQPLVMTSANLGGSPIVFRDDDSDWIDGLADGVIAHDRPIHVPCEDSVVALAGDGAVVPVRRSRGYAPLPVTVRGVRTQAVVLATGGDLKTTFCLMSADGRAHLSSHLGDMSDPRTQSCFESAYDHLASMTHRQPDLIACDMHPSYATTKWAMRQGQTVMRVQHHHAHAVSLLAEHDRLGAPILAVAYDGTGYGTDGTIWGGEFLTITDPSVFTRVGHVKPFALPGGDEAVRHPARIALDLLDRAGIEWDARLPAVRAVGESGIHILRQQLPRGLGCVPTSSMGRLFDAVASLIGVCQLVTYEGQAAVQLEHAARTGRAVPLDFGVEAGVLDPAPVIAGLVDGLRAGAEVADLAAGFHHAVIRATAVAVTDCARRADIGTVGLTGGVFVNRLLLAGLGKTLTTTGFEVLTHSVLPCNDGGLALGQAVIAAAWNPGQKESGRCA
ncbi:carbamoyltransferase HypF [Mycolicibacterium sphagni]|uniref:carbamoyltransferase HypF n=1 Tax=Mycolicibacterium sphagni TaxID=1786 RepID=UPI0021F3B42A|nr:carbamoyltransferase HypF [Mycolicibacterium sphagni]